MKLDYLARKLEEGPYKGNSTLGEGQSLEVTGTSIASHGRAKRSPRAMVG